jgi:diaminopimelate decarboxylase
MILGYRNGSLHLGETDPCPILPLAERTEGPFYLYHLGEILARVRALRTACPNLAIHYAMKANSQEKILSAFAAEGIGADVVSFGEIRSALAAGIEPSKIIFSGVAKTKDEIQFALEKRIKQINVESLEELVRVAEIAKKLNVKAPVAFRFNPDVDAGTHPYIATGLWKNKFGMDKNAVPELIAIAKQHESLSLQGISIHIGSQIADLAPIETAISQARELFTDLQREGFTMKTLDVGGGLGVDYKSDDSDFARIKAYGDLIKKATNGLNAEILCEPGRILVARTGVLVGRVEYVKKTTRKNFLICNTGVHHLVRPALYGAYHRIMPVSENLERKRITYDVVGPLCESSDVLGEDRELPKMNSGEYIAVADAGAYGMTMASRYNQQELPQEFIWQSGKLI